MFNMILAITTLQYERRVSDLGCETIKTIWVDRGVTDVWFTSNGNIGNAIMAQISALLKLINIYNITARTLKCVDYFT